MIPDDEPVDCDTYGMPGPGISVSWYEGDRYKVRWFTERGFNQRSKELVHELMKRGVRPVVMATICLWRVVKENDGLHAERIPDDYRPIFDKLMAKQVEGKGMQRAPVGTTQKTHEQMLKESA